MQSSLQAFPIFRQVVSVAPEAFFPMDFSYDFVVKLSFSNHVGFFWVLLKRKETLWEISDNRRGSMIEKMKVIDEKDDGIDVRYVGAASFIQASHCLG